MREGSDSVHTDDPMKDVATETEPVEEHPRSVEGETAPPEYEPQVELAPDQNPGITERDGATIDEVESEVNGDEAEADDGDDDAEDGEPD